MSGVGARVNRARIEERGDGAKGEKRVRKSKGIFVSNVISPFPLN